MNLGSMFAGAVGGTEAARLFVSVGADISQASRGLDEIDRKVEKQKSGWAALPKATKIAAAGVAASLILASSAAVDYESAFAGVRKTVDASEAEFAALSDGIRGMAREMPTAATEIAGVAEAAGQLGIQNKNILGFSDTMVKLGVTTNLQARDAATALARLANITQMPQENFDRLGSTVVALGNNLATTEAEIVEMGLRIAGAGKQVGMTEAEILSFAGALSSVGVEAQAGGTAISRVMSDMAMAVAQGGEKLEGFAAAAGMSAADFRAAFERDAAGAIISFIEGLRRISDEGGDVFTTLENLELADIRVRDALLRAAGAGDLFRESLKLGNQAWAENTALTKEAEERFKTTASQLQILWNNVTDLGISIGSVLLPPLNALVGGLTGLAQVATMVPPQFWTALGIAFLTKVAVGLLASSKAAVVLGNGMAGAAVKARALSLASGALKLGLIAAVPLLWEAGKGVNNFITELTRGKRAAVLIGDLRSVLEAGGDQAVKYADNLYDVGVTAESMARAIDAAHGDVDLAIHALIRNNGDLEDSLVDLANTLGEAAPAMTVEWAEAWRRMEVTTAEGGQLVADAAGKIPGQAADAMAEGAGEVEKVTADMWGDMLDETRAAAWEARTIAWGIPGAIANAIVSGPAEVDAVKARMKEIIAESVSDARTEAQNIALLINPKIAKALTGNSQQARDAMLTQVVEPMLASLDALPGVALATGEGVTGNLRRAINQQGPLVVESLRLLMEDSSATLGEMERFAREHGLEGIAALIAGMRAKKREAREAAAEVRRAAQSELQFSAYGAGQSAINSFAQGMRDQGWAAADAARYAMNLARMQFASSEPKDPRSPLRGITKAFGFWDTFTKGLRDTSGGVAGAIRDGLAIPDFGIGPQLAPIAVTADSARRPDYTERDSEGNVFNIYLEDKMPPVRSPRDLAARLRQIGEAGLLTGLPGMSRG